MIHAQNLSKKFGKILSLQDVTVHVENGSIYGLIGSNGSGKSTLLRLLSGIYLPDTGTISYDGQGVFENKAVKQRLAYISDEPYFLPQGNIQEMQSLYESVYASFDTARCVELIHAFGLDPHRKIRTFSKGMQKQVSVLLALSCRPQYLFMDETFDGLDPVMRQLVRSYVIEEVAERDMSCIIASHDLREMEDIVDHIGMLHRGNMLYERALDDMRTNMSKVQVSWNPAHSAEQEAWLRTLPVISLEKRGSLFTCILRGREADYAERFQESAPLFCEWIPLTLSEIFILEMEERGYEGFQHTDN